MYDELVKELHDSAEWADRLALLMGRAEGDAHAPIMREAADAIEELQKAVNFHKFNSEFWEDKYNSLADEKWIPVTERLPEFEDAVLCMRKSNVYGVRPHQEILYVDEYGFKNYDDIYLADGVVTHWMPLPEPPKEE